MFGNDIFAYSLLVFITLAYIAIGITSSLLAECPGKDVNEIRKQAEQYELSFLFYHVTWSTDSQAARLVYEHIAQAYEYRIFFGVIDCYHLACNCSKTYPLSLGSGAPSKWPTLVIRYSNRIVLQYNGEWTLEAVQRFIDFIFIPVERLNSRLELKRLTMQRDAVVLGVFGNGSQLEFRKFVSAGIKWLETDPVSSFRFAAAIGPAAKDILHRANDTQQRLPQVLLITSKGVVEMPPSEWNVSNIVVWLQTEFARSLNVLYGYNSPKSLTMLLHLSPVLTVIANDYFYEYMNTLTNYGISLDEQCHTDIWQSEMAKLQELGYVQHTMEKNELLKPLTCSAKEYLSQWNLRYYYALDSYLKQFICGLRRNCTFEKGLASSNNIHKLCTSKHRNSSPSMKIAAAKYLK
ncbi:uncharacterized protein LOC118756731, partial [Rhagoletis pomonella]